MAPKLVRVIQYLLIYCTAKFNRSKINRILRSQHNDMFFSSIISHTLAINISINTFDQHNTIVSLFFHFACNINRIHMTNNCFSLFPNKFFGELKFIVPNNEKYYSLWAINKTSKQIKWKLITFWFS